VRLGLVPADREAAAQHVQSLVGAVAA
jgi:hypothetical protein